MTADIPSVLSKDGTDGLGAVPSVLEESRTDYRGRPSDGTVDNTAQGGSTQNFRCHPVSPASMLPCLSSREGANGSGAIITLVEGILAAMGIVVVVLVAAGVKRVEESSAAGDTRRVGEVM